MENGFTITVSAGTMENSYSKIDIRLKLKTFNLDETSTQYIGSSLIIRVLKLIAFEYKLQFTIPKVPYSATNIQNAQAAFQLFLAKHH